jgi:two-component system, chemotaxis family, sensor kinase CheA
MKEGIHMNFKQKQIFGFGLILIFMVILLVGIGSMVNSMKGNMLEIVEDRYYKVKDVTEVRQLFYQIDREKLNILYEDDVNQLNESLTIIENNHKQIQEILYLLSENINRSKSHAMFSKVQANYSAYMEIEDNLIETVRDGKEMTELEILFNEQAEERIALIRNMNDFREYQEILMKGSLKSANDTYDNAMLFLTISSFIALLSIIVTGYWVIKTTTNNLKNISDVMKTVDLTNLNSLPRIESNTDDEIGQIAMAFNDMACSLEVYSQKEKEFTSKIEDQNWTQTRLAEMATMYQRIEDLDILATGFMSKLAPIMGASLGVFYIKMGDGRTSRFSKIASFAGEGQDAGRMEFLPGEGLIGQAVLEKQAQMIEDIPENYTLVSTGLGEVIPKCILIAPVLFEDEVVGIVELASMDGFSKLQKQFLIKALETLGITINSVRGRMEIERLLKESQAQAEELQVQSEEMQTQSEELQAQAEEMQTQAEKLRMINEQLEERNRDAELKTFELEKNKTLLEKQAAQLKLSSRYKSEFLANMSHELRTPLNSILILSEMLSDSSDDSLSKEQQEFARVIHSSGNDLLSLINDILDLSKVEVGKMEMVFGEVNLSELPGLIQRNFAHQGENQGIEFKVEKDRNVPDIFYSDEQRLQQIIKNLLSNAFKFTEGGSVVLRFSQPAPEIVAQWQQTEEESAWLEVSVTDTGIGIPDDKQDLIFEAFQQVDGATMRKYGGTGLGLSICKEFAKLLGGHILVESSEGKGSKFSLYIPNLPNGLNKQSETIIATEEVAVGIVFNEVQRTQETIVLEMGDAETSTPDISMNFLNNKKVLVVDDDKRNIYALKNALIKEGMEIHTAEEGKESLEILEKVDDIDIVLMDIMMPGMDGYETMRRIRSNPTYDQLPIIALTAKAMKGDREKCLVAGASDYISKPLKIDQLLSVLRVWLSN